MTAKLEERLRELNKIEDVCNEHLSVKDRRVLRVLRSRVNYALCIKGEFSYPMLCPALILRYNMLLSAMYSCFAGLVKC